jgi:hypothetical protein
MKPFILAAAALIAVAATPAHAVSCAPAGTVNVFNVTDGYAFFVSKTYGDGGFMIPGTGFVKDPAAPPGSTMFTVDGVHYQYLTVPKAKFIGSAATSDDASILARHAQQEHKFALRAGSPFTSFKDRGNRPKPAQQGSPAFVFKMWTMADPKKPQGPSQYMLTTVIGADVALLAAIVPSPAQHQRVMAVMDRYAASYHLLQSAAQCPAKPAAGAAKPG